MHCTKDLVCQKTHQLTTSPSCSSPLGRKWGSSVERAVDQEALDPGFIFSFAPILVPLVFSYLIYNANGNKILPLVE